MKALVTILISALTGLGVNADLVKNFDMAEIGEHGFPAHWRISHPVHLEQNHTRVSREEVTEGGNVFPVLRVIKTEQINNVQVGNQEVDIPPGTTAIYIQSRMRARDVQYGDAFWQRPGVGLTFLFEDGSSRSGSLDRWLHVPEGDSGWQIYEVTIPVAEGANRASVSVVAQGWSGILDIDWILVRAVRD
jgi:hypothetical protein